MTIKSAILTLTEAPAPRTFTGKVDRDGIYAWLNPDMPHAERYDAARLLADFVETDEDTYDYFLGMLPPVHFTHDGFAICEETTGSIRLGFFRLGGRYFAAHISDFDAPHKIAATRAAIAKAIGAA